MALSTSQVSESLFRIKNVANNLHSQQRFNGVSREISFDKKMGTVTDNRFGLFNVGYGRTKNNNDNFVDYETIGLSKVHIIPKIAFS